MKRGLVLVTLFGLSLTHSSSFAQMFAGYDQFCGVPVVVMRNSQNASAARDQFGRAVIYIDPGVMGNWTMSRKFVLAHECGHHMLGHTLPQGMWFRNTRYWATARQELEADCWAATQLARTEDTADLRGMILQFASRGPSRQGPYPSGWQRANAAAQCAGIELQSHQLERRVSRTRWQYEYSRLDSDIWRKSIKFSTEEACNRSQRRRDARENYVALECEEVEE